MKLYRVSTTVEVLVVAENEDQAHDVGSAAIEAEWGFPTEVEELNPQDIADPDPVVEVARRPRRLNEFFPERTKP